MNQTLRVICRRVRAGLVLGLTLIGLFLGFALFVGVGHLLAEINLWLVLAEFFVGLVILGAVLGGD